jgi:hypothetical protein
MTSTHEAEFDLPALRPEARHAHIVPELHNCSLLSIGQLTDAGYIAVFDAARLRIFDSPTIEAINSTKCILTGTRHTPTGMWHINAPTQPIIRPHFANRIGEPTTAELVAFAHATMFSPALSTLEKSLSNGFLTLASATLTAPKSTNSLQCSNKNINSPPIGPVHNTSV